MGRPTQKFVTANKDKLEKISEEHKYLIEDFLIYCKAEGKSPKTIVNYRSDLNIFFCWYEENCKLKGKYKPFSKIKVQDVIKLQSYLVELGMSPSRMERFKASISSLSNYCENILAEDEDYPEFHSFRNIIRKVKSVPKEEVREKTILTDVQCQNFLNKLVSEERYQQACAFALAWASGRRKAELLCIKRSHITDENLKFGALIELA
jgi:site-specific recombinase XerD